MNQQQDVMAECTFAPNTFKYDDELNTRAKSYDVTTRLYSNAMNKLLRIKSIYEEKKSVDASYEKESKECTFSPRIKEV